MAMNLNGESSQTPDTKPSHSLFSRFTWYELVAIPLVATGVAVYWFRATLLDWYFAAQEQVLFSLGLGVVPLGIWLAVVAWALAARRSWFRRYRLWLGAIALLAVTFGAMSFFRPLDGTLGWFTIGGEVSLGGFAGEAIAGPVAWQGILRLVGISLLGFAVVTPTLAADSLMALGRVLVYGYVAFVLVARWIGRMYRRHDEDAGFAYNVGSHPTQSSATRESSHANMRSLQEYDLTTDFGSGGIVSSPSRYIGSIVSTSPSPAPEPYEEMEGNPYSDIYMARDEEDTDEIEEDIFQPSAGPESEEYPARGQVMEERGLFDSLLKPTLYDDVEDDSSQAGGKFNRFWDSPRNKSQPAVNGEQKGRNPLTMSLLGKKKEEWAKPPMKLLQDIPDKGISEKQIRETAQTIQKTLADYGIEVEIGQIRPGPTVTMYGLIPGWVRRYKQVKKTDENGRPVLDGNGKQVFDRVENSTRVKVDSILSREKDLALALKTPSLRIETPVMGQSQVGIEIPNPSPSPVTLRSVMESEEFQKLRTKAHLPVAFGKGSGGETEVIDLAKMPHLLIAGATGSGKSVCLNTIVSCLIMEKTPADLRLLLIDPKRVELTQYNGIPHLLTSVVVEVDQVVPLLKGVISEMMDRYRRMEDAGVKNIEAYNKRFPEDKMPFLLVVVDELADLMMTAAFDVEQSLCRLAQLGRATGIHLIVATQRPSVDVVTGLIKANFPSRVSFGVTSYIDSRTILDTTGAEKLLGRGDMLYLPLDASRPVRIQGVFISDKETENLVKFWQTTRRGWLPHISLRPAADEESGDDGAADGSTDELFQKAVELAHTHSKLSTSLLQRRLRIGYPRAARLMDELEEKGIVGPSDGSKSRDVIMNSM